MTSSVQYLQAGDGAEFHAPDATVRVKVDSDHTENSYEIFEIDAPRLEATPLHRTGWAKSYYMLRGRMIVQVDGEGFDLAPGASVAIPAGALHTFTVLTPSARFLVFSLTGAMGRFHADLDEVVHGRSLEDSMDDIRIVLGRHDVTMQDEEALG